MHRTLFSLLGLVVAPIAPLAAQSAADGSNAVVQGLPSPAVGERNAALRRISRNARDVDALIDAGSASLRLDDIEAAIGFYTRAREAQPGNAQAALGLAQAYMRSDRPVEALDMFRAAEKAGATGQSFAADRGLAYDLVGDNAAAQQEYARVLSGANGDEVRRRLALSQAIQGNREAFERTLYPLLEKQDFAAYRTRAFALAILGQEQEAIAITEAVMPTDLSARIAPYLNYMRRLTPAQQAAAANLGNFPRAAQIGRDDPSILAYREGTGAVRTADAALAPSGPPLGSAAEPVQARADTAAQRRRPGRGTGRLDEPAAVVSPPSAAVAAQAVQAPAQAAPVPALPVPSPAPTTVARSEPLPPVQDPIPSPPIASAEPVIQDTQVAAAGPPVAQPGFDLARVSQPVERVVEPAPAVAAPAPLLPEPTPAPAPARVADAFADLASAPSTAVARAPDAVDITRIKPPREVEKKPDPPAAAKAPAPPPHPSRHWVQLATGRDKAALRFDWRRFSAKAPDLLSKMEPHVAAWGQTNRLLAGPYDTPRAANTALAALKKLGLDGFTFTSDAGEAVDRLR